MLNFDDLLTKYTILGFCLVFLLCLFFLKYSVHHHSGRWPLWLPALLFLCAFAFMRYPFIFFNRELEVDESQMLAQALSLKKYWIYWKYVDGLTQGPLSIYFLIIPTWIGMNFDYITARLVGFIVLNATLFFTYLTFKNLFDRRISIIIFTPVVLFYLLSQGFFSALYNEYFVLFLLSICFWLFSIIYIRKGPMPGVVFALAFIAGMIPFAKLQGVPNAAIIVIFAAILMFRRSDKKWRHASLMFIGGISFPLIVFALVIYFEAFEYFWKFYVIGNLEYSGAGTFITKVLAFPDFLRHSGQFAFLLFSYLLLIGYILFLAIRSKSLAKINIFLLSFSIFQLVFALYSIIKPGYYFQHYLQFLIIPLGLFTGVLLHAVFNSVQWSAKKVRIASLIWLSICFLPHAINKISTTLGYTSANYQTIGINQLGKPLSVSSVSREINKYKLPKDDITIWGWEPSYHLETKASQGTSDVMVYRLLTPAPKQQDYIAKYVSDLGQRKPAVFVDEITTSSTWFPDPVRYSHEKIPALRNFVAQNYRYITTINNERIYVRKDRTIKSQ